MNLTEEEKRRYQKLMSLSEMGEEAQCRLKASHVLVIGAGGLGAGVLPILSASGIGHIGVAEADIIETSNLQRQILYAPDDIGKSKMDVAAAQMQRLNPEMKLTRFDERLDETNVERIIENFDLVLDCTDNFKTRFLINDMCADLKKPLVYGSVHDYEGMVMILHHHRQANLRDLYDTEPLNQPPAAGIIPTLPQIIGSIQANETIKLISETGQLLDGSMLIFNALTNNTQIIKL